MRNKITSSMSILVSWVDKYKIKRIKLRPFKNKPTFKGKRTKNINKNLELLQGRSKIRWKNKRILIIANNRLITLTIF